MKEDVQSVLTELGRCLLDRDLVAAEGYLAGWCSKKTRQQLRSDLLTIETEVRREVYQGRLPDPDSIALDENPATLGELRAEGLALPRQITEDNFEGWCCLTVLCGEEEQVLLELWCAMVSTEDGARIGYFEVYGP